MDEVLNIGKYSIPFLLTMALAVIYSFAPSASDRMKNGIALLAGIGLGLLGLYYGYWQGKVVIGPVVLIDYIIYGFLQGAAAVGLWKSLNIQKGGTL
jgi:hypothetical protein